MANSEQKGARMFLLPSLRQSLRLSAFEISRTAEGICMELHTY
jgi:hypothetical protein